jgi:hypothetical protein
LFNSHSNHSETIYYPLPSPSTGGRVGRHPARIYSRWDMGNIIQHKRSLIPSPQRMEGWADIQEDLFPLGYGVLGHNNLFGAIIISLEMLGVTNG